MKTIRQIIEECLESRITVDEAVYQIEKLSAGEYFLISPSIMNDLKEVIISAKNISREDSALYGKANRLSNESIFRL